MNPVAYLGPEKTNTHFAAVKRFGKRARYIHLPTVEAVFRQVEAGLADFGVVPVENSLEGAVTHTLDRFIGVMDSPIQIFGELIQPIRHYLITRGGAGKIRVVYSHPQALAQCRRWLEKRTPGAELRETGSTAEAVERLAAGRAAGRAAIGRLELARKHKLRAVPIPIAEKNRTRFLVLSLKTPPKGRKNKTSLMFALKDRPGALHRALAPFTRHHINMSRIESRPSKRRAWEYLFFVDLEGHRSDKRVAAALRGVARQTAGCKVLGSYPLRQR